MATSMTAEMPAADRRVRKPVRTPNPPPNSAMIANRVKIAGMPRSFSKLAKVAVRPLPPSRPSSFWEPCAIKISPRGIRSIRGAIRSVASKPPLAIGFLRSFNVQQPVFPSSLDFIHEHVRLFDDLLHTGRSFGIGYGADTETDRPVVCGHRLIQLELNLSQECCSCIGRCFRQQDDKLVAAKTGKDVSASDIRGNGFCNR